MGLVRPCMKVRKFPIMEREAGAPKLRTGLILAIEPMVNMGTRSVIQESDGWTIRTRDHMPSAHYEHTVAVMNGTPEILTTHKYIEEVFQI